MARILAGLEEARDFALAGGAALIIRGEVERRTRDLDFFGPSGEAVDQLCELAREKDRGFDTGVLAEMLSRFDRLRRDEFELDQPRYEQLEHAVGRWRAAALELAVEAAKQRDRDVVRGQGFDLGL